MKPTKNYFEALEDATAHHASNKTYSGSFLRPHAPFIKELITQHGVRSILDYGCGKGEQYKWISAGGEDQCIPQGETLESYWGVPVTKYDPAYPPFAQEPHGIFDLVLCTHVLGSIPITDLPWVVQRLYALASKVVYVAEKLGPVRKQVFRNPEVMPRGLARRGWEAVLQPVPVRLEVWLSTREKTEDRGVIVTREQVR